MIKIAIYCLALVVGYYAYLVSSYVQARHTYRILGNFRATQFSRFGHFKVFRK